MPKCGACAKFTGRDTLVCPKCSGHYHHACVAIAAGSAVPRDWTCPTCKRFLPRDNKTDTPVKGLHDQAATSQATASQPAAAPAALTANDMDREVLVQGSPSTFSGGPGADVQSMLGHEIQQFREELRAVRQDLRDFCDEFLDVRKCMADFNSKVDKLDSRVDAIEKQVANSVASTATKVLEEAIANLQLELQDRDQELLSNDVQISSVPEEPGENVSSLAARVCAKLGVELDARDVVSVHRAGRTREQGRPRPIVLRLARRAVRDEVLRSARVRRAATTAELGLKAAPQKFYVNERLTNANRQLFQQARERARAASWRYVWTRDGRIFARKADGQPCIRMRRVADLDIFSPVDASNSHLYLTVF